MDKEQEMAANLVAITEKFDLLSYLVKGVSTRHMRGLVVGGAPGIGKTWSIMETLRSYSKSKKPKRIKHMSGHVTPSATYKTLEEYRDQDSIIVFDDCDNVFQDVKSLNLLKAATDSSRIRTISWESDRQQTPSFDFDGGIIVISNGRFSGPHYKAFLDRVHYYDMDVSTGEKLAKINNTALKSGEVNATIGQEIVDYLFENQGYIDYVSLRTFYKVAQLAKMAPTKWKELAKVTVFKTKEMR